VTGDDWRPYSATSRGQNLVISALEISIGAHNRPYVGHCLFSKSGRDAYSAGAFGSHQYVAVQVMLLVAGETDFTRSR
jgi:hypothetical protein